MGYENLRKISMVNRLQATSPETKELILEVLDTINIPVH
jgi:hypothetical protein